MARGKKEDNPKIKEQARAMLVTDTVAAVAHKLGKPWSTINSWKKEFEKEDENHEGSFTKLREKQRAKFIEDAWRTVGKAQNLLERKLDRAIESEDREHEPSVKELAAAIGTLYDKASLAAREPTEIVAGNVVMTRFEDL